MFQCNMKTHVSMPKYDFKWTIEDFSEVLEEEETFIYFKINKECWYFGLKHERDCSLVMTLYRSASESNIRIKSDLEITDCDGKLLYNELGHFTYKTNIYHNQCHNVAFVYGEPFKKIKKESNDTIIITLNLKMFIVSTRDAGDLPQEKELQTEVQKSFSADILSMLDSNTQTDIVLLVEGEKVGAHKAIVCARSPVFAKMFQMKMSESENNVVCVEDVSVTVMKEVIGFMYSRVKLDYDLDTALDVYYAADKYEVAKLRELCGKIILNKLNSENAGLLLQLGDRHKDVRLKTKVMRFIKDNFETCVNSCWWDNFKNKRNHEIFNELISFVSE